MLPANETDHFYGTMANASQADSYQLVPTYPYNYVLSALLIAMSVMGSICNCLSLVVISLESRVKTSTVLITSLAVTDLCTCAITIPAQVYMILTNNKVNEEIICHLYYVFVITGVPYSAIIVAGIAIDRMCYALVPYCHIMQVKTVKVFVSLAAIATLVFAVLSALSYSVYQVNTEIQIDEPRHTGQCDVSRDMYLSWGQMDLLSNINTAIFILCMVVTAVAYCFVFVWALRRHMHQAELQRQRNLYLVNHGSVTAKVNRSRTTKRTASPTFIQTRNLRLYFRTLLTVVLVTAVFVASTTPGLLLRYQVIHVSFNTQFCLYYLHYINSWANPFIYFAVNDTFRNNLRRLLRRKLGGIAKPFTCFSASCNLTALTKATASHKDSSTDFGGSNAAKIVALAKSNQPLLEVPPPPPSPKPNDAESPQSCVISA